MEIHHVQVGLHDLECLKTKIEINLSSLAYAK